MGSSVPVSEVKLLQPPDTVTSESDWVAETQYRGVVLTPTEP